MTETEDPAKTTETFPETVGGCLALLAKIMKQRTLVEVKLQPLNAREKALREHIFDTFKKDDLKGARGSGLLISIATTVVPQLKDWNAFWAFAKKKGNEDLLPRSVASPAWRERYNEGKKVPGIETFTNTTMRISADKSAAKKGD